jgi:NAD-dependent dihydropyrimidine dehydrogenase PreA subunit
VKTRPFLRPLTLVLCALVVAACLVARADARQAQPSRPVAAAPAGRPAASAGAPVAAQKADPFGFSEDEDATPTFAQIIRGEALNLSLLTAFTALALVGFFRKNETLKTITLVASVAYLGFYKSSLITIVNVYGLLSWNLPTLRDGILTYFVFVFMLASTVVWGRLYCGRVCAFGALTQLMDKVVPARFRVAVPPALERRAGYIKYGLLALVLLVFFITRNPYAYYRYVEPFWMFSRHASVLEWTGLGVLLVATVFVRNLYCRFLCPLGAFLGVISQVTTVFRIKRWSECKTCKICEKTCEWGAIRGPKIVRSECVRCDDCERLYLDQQKCPHWIIIRRRSDFANRPPIAPAH